MKILEHVVPQPASVFRSGQFWSRPTSADLGLPYSAAIAQAHAAAKTMTLAHVIPPGKAIPS